MEWIYIGLTIFFWGFAPVFDKIALKTVSPLIAIAVRMMWSAFVMILFVLFADKTETIINLPFKNISFLFVSASVSLLGYMFYFRALSKGNASKVVPAVATFPLVTAIIAFSLMGDPFSAQKLSAIILIVSGIILLH
ncbi:MAG: EamA family transporter [Endomicrobiaceae bacterium]|nr:EamA family transporter [Endomicrobiaceae bacterium]